MSPSMVSPSSASKAMISPAGDGIVLAGDQMAASVGCGAQRHWKPSGDQLSGP
jgi:hypothetical protein